MEQRVQPVIAIFGSGTCPPSSMEYQAAFELGRRIAERGWAVCNGGYAGTMEASARGAREAGGAVIGVTCSAFGPHDGNAFLTERTAAPTLLERLRLLVDRSHASVVLPGGTGTLLELALVWELVNKGLIASRPLVLLGDFWTPVAALIAKSQPSAVPPCVASSAGQALDILAIAISTARGHNK